METINQIRTNLIEKLNLHESSGHEAISKNIIKLRGTNLEVLEKRFRAECVEYFNLDNNSWENIAIAYLNNFYALLNANQDSQKRNLLINEIRRIQIAKLIQVNKFLASEKEIYSVINEL